MVTPPLSQTNYTQESHRKYTISIDKNLAVVAKRATRVAPTTRPDLTGQQKTDPVRVFSSLFKVDPRACPIKSYRCTALQTRQFGKKSVLLRFVWNTIVWQLR